MYDLLITLDKKQAEALNSVIDLVLDKMYDYFDDDETAVIEQIKTDCDNYLSY